MAIVIPDHARVTVEGTLLGRPWANVFYVDKNSSALLTQAEGSDIADIFELAWSTHLDGVFSNDWAMQTIRVADVQTSTSPSYQYSKSLAGALTNETLSPDTCGIVSWATNLRGPRYRGRTYLAGWTEASNEDTGRPSSGAQGAMQSWADYLLAELLLNGTPLAIGHPDINSATNVFSGDAKPAWRRQKRRNYRT
ncbi:MAG TPA: hypothetical protein VJQ57_15840 [Acidimicrobiia bacterium]|nr:hypothetical protein [Acidimicrobiia bacterium]